MKDIKTRIQWIDMAKGYGIILVILAHLNVGKIAVWIYTFHMPLFFFLAGYLFNAKYDIKTFLKKKIKCIVIPYFSLGIPMLIVQTFFYAYEGVLTKEIFLLIIRNFILQQRMWSIWFIACLFCLNVVFFAFVKCFKRDWIIVFVTLLMTVIGLKYYDAGGGAWFWSSDVCFTAIPFFASGYYYRKYGEKFEQILKNRRVSFLLIFMFLMINIVMGYFSLDENGIGLEMAFRMYGSQPIYTYVSAFSGILFIVLVSKQAVFSAIRYIGENSMLYFAWHQTIFIPIITTLLNEIWYMFSLGRGSIAIIIYNVIACVSIILIITVCNVIIKKMGLQFMLGK